MRDARPSVPGSGDRASTDPAKACARKIPAGCRLLPAGPAGRAWSGSVERGASSAASGRGRSARRVKRLPVRSGGFFTSRPGRRAHKYRYGAALAERVDNGRRRSRRGPPRPAGCRTSAVAVGGSARRLGGTARQRARPSARFGFSGFGGNGVPGRGEHLPAPVPVPVAAPARAGVSGPAGRLRMTAAKRPPPRAPRRRPRPGRH